MPISDPRDRLFYQHHTPVQDTYFVLDKEINANFVWFSGAIWETPSKKTAVILSHLYVIGLRIVLRDVAIKLSEVLYFSTILAILQINIRGTTYVTIT